MEEKLKTLIELLDQLQDRTGILPSEDEDADEVLDQVLDLADELLITNKQRSAELFRVPYLEQIRVSGICW